MKRNFTEELELISWLDSDSYAAATYDLAAYVNCEEFREVVFVFNLGDMAAGATMDVDIETATSAAGANATNVKSITQLTQAGGDSNAKVCVTVDAIEMEEAYAGSSYINAEVTIGTDAVEFGLMVYGRGLRYEPASQANWTEVLDISDS